jgi:hypothetical protein
LFASFVLLLLIITKRFDLTAILIQALQVSADLIIIALAVVAMLIFFAVAHGRNGFRRLGLGLQKIFTFFHDVWYSSVRTRLVERLISLIAACHHVITNPSLLKHQTLKILRAIGKSSFEWFGFLLIAGPAIFATMSNVPYWIAISTTISVSLLMGYSIVLLARGLLIVTLRVIQVFDRSERVVSRLAAVGIILVSLGFILQIISVVV